MMKFRDNKRNIIKEAYSIKEIEDKLIVQFSKDGKEYTYSKNNIELIMDDRSTDEIPFIVYEFNRLCYKCKRQTKILTYIKFPNGDDLIYPWDKERLNEEKSLEETITHMQHPEIEWYPIMVIGSDEVLDNIMLEKFPDFIKKQYSNIQNRIYPMNICEKCGAKQGEFFIYKELNEKIQRMEQINIYKNNI